MYFPVIPQVILGLEAEKGRRDVLRNGIILYYVLDRVSFLTYEKNAIKVRAAGAKITHKLLTIRKFVQDYSLAALVRAVTNDRENAVTTHQDILKKMQVLIDSRVRILELTLEMI